jgi:hypothetical protein
MGMLMTAYPTICLVDESSRLRTVVANLRSSLKVLILVCDCAGAAALVWLLNKAALIPFRRAKDAHWTERARALDPEPALSVSSGNVRLRTLHSTTTGWGESPIATGRFPGLFYGV